VVSVRAISTRSNGPNAHLMPMRRSAWCWSRHASWRAESPALELLRDAFSTQLRVELGLAISAMLSRTSCMVMPDLGDGRAEFFDVLALLADHDSGARMNVMFAGARRARCECGWTEASASFFPSGYWRTRKSV